MNRPEAVVIRVDGEHVHVVTEGGDFRRVRMSAMKRRPREGEIISIPRRQNRRKYLLTAALLAAAVMMIALYPLLSSPGVSVAAYLEVEVNPAVRLGLDASQRVVTAEPLTAGAGELLEGARVDNLPVHRAASALIDAACELGYLHEAGDNLVMLALYDAAEEQSTGLDISDIRQGFEEALAARNVPGFVAGAYIGREISSRAREHGWTTARELLRMRAEELDMDLPPGLLRSAPLRDITRGMGLPAGIFAVESDDCDEKDENQDCPSGEETGPGRRPPVTRPAPSEDPNDADDDNPDDELPGMGRPHGDFRPGDIGRPTPGR